MREIQPLQRVRGQRGELPRGPDTTSTGLTKRVKLVKLFPDNAVGRAPLCFHGNLDPLADAVTAVGSFYAAASADRGGATRANAQQTAPSIRQRLFIDPE